LLAAATGASLMEDFRIGRRSVSLMSES